MVKTKMVKRNVYESWAENGKKEKMMKEKADLPSWPCCTPAVSLIPEKSSSQMLLLLDIYWQ